MSITPERRAELEAKRRAVQAELKARAEWERARDWIRPMTDRLDRSGAPYAVEELGSEAWDWIEAHFPIRTRGMHDAFIDWDRVPHHARPPGGDAGDPAAWLAGVQRSEGLGNPEVLVLWARDLALRMRFDDVVANAAILDHAFHAWVVCREAGWAVQVEWDGWGWGRAVPGAGSEPPST